MNGKELFERWNSVHALKYYEKYPDKEITEQRIFDYVDTVHSNILRTLLENYALEHIFRDFRSALEDFK
jgi:hypothetical protein